MELLSLPVEMLDEIFRYLAPNDIISLSLTCKKLRGLADSDQLWVQVCKNKFKISIPPNGLAQIFYKSVLQRYGHLLGCWRKQAFDYEAENPDGQLCQVKDYYGGLLQVLYSDGQIIGFDLLPPKAPHLMKPLRPEKLFSISMDESEKFKAVIKCYCSITPLKHDTCELGLSDEGSLTIQCGTAEQQGSGEFDLDSYYQEKDEQWIRNQMDVDPTNVNVYLGMASHLHNKLETLLQCAVNMTPLSYSKLALPGAISSFLVPIQPGLFKGTFFGYGIQILALEYLDQRTVRATKITGDEGVPAGIPSFEADLGAAMCLNDEAQTSMAVIRQMDFVPSALTWNELPNTQPFVLPQGCHYDDYVALSDQCKSRFLGTGLFDYQQNLKQRGHWIVFNEDLFGFLWITSCKFSLFHRVQEPI